MIDPSGSTVGKATVSVIYLRQSSRSTPSAVPSFSVAKQISLTLKRTVDPVSSGMSSPSNCHTQCCASLSKLEPGVCMYCGGTEMSWVKPNVIVRPALQPNTQLLEIVHRLKWPNWHVFASNLPHPALSFFAKVGPLVLHVPEGHESTLCKA